ncbi:hypothetical protein CISG_09546 [Coccidioides immitis RMSCC 3703]|uniref:Uncharacterized protein n=2 Tax=Coccidioides immitis TaxID=5501 RepID=A0A0J8QJ98_COCIT|nr:hypothetical protein CIRG_09439 [Coccidioides immitis RMSCC 2394]KMU72469.1 hypothetical protein CISG_09546 [Coccidioides immitis RMSCC 3703]
MAPQQGSNAKYAVGEFLIDFLTLKPELEKALKSVPMSSGATQDHVGE